MLVEKKSFVLRIDSKLFDELRAWADDELRSVNGQVEYLLREAVRQRRGARVGLDAEKSSTGKKNVVGV